MISSIRSLSAHCSTRLSSTGTSKFLCRGLISRNIHANQDQRRAQYVSGGNLIYSSSYTTQGLVPMKTAQSSCWAIPFRNLSLTSKAQSTQGELVKVITLNNISDNPGAVKTARRVGRGIGSSKGKTSGRGHKGQKARSGGGPHPLFEGGQTRFYRRIPKRGFTNVLAEPMVPINLGTLQDYVDMGRVIPQANPDDPPLTIKDLVAAGMLKNSTIKHGVKLLAKGKERLRTPLRIEISRASSDAITALESVGGQVTTVHYNKLALRTLLKPHKFEGKIMPKRASPPPKLMTYYTSHDKRGYLSPENQLKKVRSQLINENAST